MTDDLDTPYPVDLIVGRDGDASAAGLLPQAICRASGYAEGARHGAPDVLEGPAPFHPSVTRAAGISQEPTERGFSRSG